MAEEAPPEEPAPEPPPDPAVVARFQEALNTEFVYYSSILRLISAALTTPSDRVLIIPWIKKLFQPEYQSTKLKEKRNRYLNAITITLLNDEVSGIFKEKPPNGTLTELEKISNEPIPAAEWETDTLWYDLLTDIPSDFVPYKCTIHKTVDALECKADHQIDQVLDQEFQFLLYIVRPYASLLGSTDKLKVAYWLQILCTIQGNDFCSSMRAVRNDYIMALLSYLQDKRVVAPFTEYPPKDTLLPLPDVCKNIKNLQKPITDPTASEADEFLKDQPVPTNGAFCYIAITGELIKSSFG